MINLAEPESPGELKDLRAQVAGRRPEELSRARGLLLAEVRAVREDAGRGRPGLRFLRPPGPYPPRFRSPFGRAPRPILIVAVAAAAAAVLTVSLLPGTTARQPHPGQRMSGTSPQPGQVPPGTQVLTAAYILGRAASAAATAAAPAPRPGQFIYVSSVTTYLELSGAPTDIQAWLHKTSRQIWQSVDGQQAGMLQIVEDENQKLPWGPTPPAVTGNRTSLTSLPAGSCPGAAPQRSTYMFLTTLPTDPRLLRAWIYQHPDDGGPKSDEQAWTDIGDMLREMLVPPKLAAALFKVAATIPGAAVVPDAANAVGLRGVAVSLSGARSLRRPPSYRHGSSAACPISRRLRWMDQRAA
jgi:hypothetical protein